MRLTHERMAHARPRRTISLDRNTLRSQHADQLLGGLSPPLHIARNKRFDKFAPKSGFSSMGIIWRFHGGRPSFLDGVESIKPPRAVQCFHAGNASACADSGAALKKLMAMEKAVA